MEGSPTAICFYSSEVIQWSETHLVHLVKCSAKLPRLACTMWSSLTAHFTSLVLALFRIYCECTECNFQRLISQWHQNDLSSKVKKALLSKHSSLNQIGTSDVKKKKSYKVFSLRVMGRVFFTVLVSPSHWVIFGQTFPNYSSSGGNHQRWRVQTL